MTIEIWVFIVILVISVCVTVYCMWKRFVGSIVSLHIDFRSQPIVVRQVVLTQSGSDNHELKD